MGLIRVIIELLALYLIYKLIFDFIIPVYKTTKQVNQKMSDMQSKMNDHFTQQQKQPGTTKESTASKGREDYIEFEEVK